MEANAARTRILEDHVVLRRRLRELAAAVDAMQVDPRKQRLLAELACGLLAELAVHLEYEDAILAPVLREVDAWGHIRATKLLEHHASQRKQLASLAELYGGTVDPERVAQRTLAWIEDVQDDMNLEEGSVLALLKDDCVVVATESG